MIDNTELLYIFIVEFSFSPSPNITVIQTAVYNCSVDIKDAVDINDAVAIQWEVNGIVSTSSTITSLGIVTVGETKQNSSLTIPGDITMNTVTVWCIASGFIDGPYFNSSNATLYIQGA